MATNLRLRRAGGADPQGRTYFDSTPIGSTSGRYLLFRKIDSARGTWVVRLTNAQGRKQQQRLGSNTAQYGYEQAVQ